MIRISELLIALLVLPIFFVLFICILHYPEEPIEMMRRDEWSVLYIKGFFGLLMGIAFSFIAIAMKREVV